MNWSLLGIILAAVVLWLLHFVRKKPNVTSSFEYPYVSLKEVDLRGVLDDDLEERVLDHALWHIGIEFKDAREKLQSLPLPVQYVYSTWWVEAEVNNGGFNQYFVNSAGKLSDVALRGYEEMGLESHKSLLLRAIAINCELLEAEGKEKREYQNLEDFAASYQNNPLNELDLEFYKLEDPRETKAQYIRKNISELEQ